MLFLAKSLKFDPMIDVSAVILSKSKIKLKELMSISHEFNKGNFDKVVTQIFEHHRPKVIIYDLSLELLKVINAEVFTRVKEAGCFQIGIDNLLRYSAFTDFTLVPSFRINNRYSVFINERVNWGWDSFLIPPPSDVQLVKNNKLLILTGSSDVAGLSKVLPQLLNDHLLTDLEINWVQGPMAQPPDIPINPRHSWVVHFAPDGLGQLMRNCSYGLAVYGVSLFELISYQVPTVTLSPYNGKDDEDMRVLEDDGIALCGSNAEHAVLRLNELVSDDEKFQSIQEICRQLMKKNGSDIIISKIHSILE
jgi:spore coat polysaccharide biosynthesis predicted glycosyltransferase SpsG